MSVVSPGCPRSWVFCYCSITPTALPALPYNTNTGWDHGKYNQSTVRHLLVSLTDHPPPTCTILYLPGRPKVDTDQARPTTLPWWDQWESVVADIPWLCMWWSSGWWHPLTRDVMACCSNQKSLTGESVRPGLLLLFYSSIHHHPTNLPTYNILKPF